MAAALSSGVLTAAISGRLPGAHARRVGKRQLPSPPLRFQTSPRDPQLNPPKRRPLPSPHWPLRGNIGRFGNRQPSMILRGAAELNGTRVRILPDASASARRCSRRGQRLWKASSRCLYRRLGTDRRVGCQECRLRVAHIGRHPGGSRRNHVSSARRGASRAGWRTGKRQASAQNASASWLAASAALSSAAVRRSYPATVAFPAT